MSKAPCMLLVLSCTICFLQNAQGARILGVFPLQSSSHFIMFQEVMKALADEGHQVEVISHFPQKKPYPNYTDTINLGGTLPIVLNNMTYDFMQTIQGAALETLVTVTGNEPCGLLDMPEVQELIKNPPTDPRYDLVIAEFFFASCYFAFGRHLHVPMIGLSSAAMFPHINEPFGNPLNPAIVSEIAERPVSPMNYWQRIKNTLLILVANVQVRYYMKEQNAIVRKHFGPDMPDIEQLEREVSLLLVNSHPILHGVRPMTPAVVEVAGVHVRDDNTSVPADTRKWMDDSKNGFIYFSLGSMVKVESFPKAALAEMYSAFAQVAPIRVLIKVASPEELPPGLPDNVLTLSWAPQVQVLSKKNRIFENTIPYHLGLMVSLLLEHKNIRGFLTHGGLMGLQEAITFAVPLIGMPLFGDQPGNIDMCVDRGIAVSLDYTNLKADEIAAAINAVANDPKYKSRMKSISKEFLDRPRNARDTAVFWIEYILKYGGNALRSPAVELTWWQVALLDVYGTIIAVVLIVFYALKLILSAIFGRILVTGRPLPASKKRN